MEYDSKNVTQIQTEAINEYEKGNKEIAIKLLKQTVLDHPNNSVAQNNLACILWDVGLHWEALFVIKRAVSANPLDRQAASNLAKISTLLKELRLRRPDYKFKGWQMENNHAFPWRCCKDNKSFLQAHSDCISSLNNREVIDMDAHMWRHWIISFAVRYAVEFTEERDVGVVECGVADGLSAFFALREFQCQVRKGQLDCFEMHLFDSWQAMQAEYLLPSENDAIGCYSVLDIERTKRNLREFQEYTFYHQGFVPDSLNSEPVCTRPIIYIHIDLNSTMPSVTAIDHFWDQILPKGVIILDDFGWPGYKDTKEAVEQYFTSKNGILLPFPTGQAFFIKND